MALVEVKPMIEALVGFGSLITEAEESLAAAKSPKPSLLAEKYDALRSLGKF